MELAECKNAVIVIDAMPANATLDDAMNTLHVNRLNLDDISSKLCLGKDASRPRSLKCLFTSDFTAKTFITGARTAGLNAKPDVPKSVRAKASNVNLKCRGAKLLVEQDIYYVDPFTKAFVKATLAPLHP